MDKYKRQEIIRACELDFNFFSALCLPSVMEEEFPPEYVAMSEMVMEAAKDTSKEDHNFALGLPRGHAKTTWAKIFTAWLFCFTHRSYALVGCSSEAKAQNFIGDVARILSSPNITRLFGSYDENAEKDSATLKVFNFRGHTRILHAVGASGDPRGNNIDFKRPDIQICDDLQSRKNAKSEVESKSLLDWYAATYYLTKSPKGMVHLYVGNTYPYAGCILSQLRKNPNYTSFVVGGILANGEALWPALNSKEKLLEDFKKAIDLRQPETFLSEIMNDDRSFAAIGFDYSGLAKYDKEDYEKPMSGYIMVDVAGNNTGSDDTAIGACLIYDDLTKPYFRDVVAGRMSPLDTIKEAMKMAVRYNIKAIFIESIAYQASLLFWANHICNQFQLQGFEFYPIRPGPGAKNSRIVDSLSQLQRGEILLHEDISSVVVSQISQFDPTSTRNKDDILDLLHYAKEIPIRHPDLISLLISPLDDRREDSSSYNYPEILNSPI